MSHNLPFLLRVSHNLSVKEVAEKLKIKEADYLEIESDQSRVSAEQASLLAELYHIEAKFFLSHERPLININTGTNNRMIINLFATHYYEDSPNIEKKDFSE